jgi:hypothetical protein
MDPKHVVCLRCQARRHVRVDENLVLVVPEKVGTSSGRISVGSLSDAVRVTVNAANTPRTPGSSSIGAP